MKRTQPDEVFLGRALIRRLHQAHADQIPARSRSESSVAHGHS